MTEKNFKKGMADLLYADGLDDLDRKEGGNTQLTEKNFEKAV